VAKSCRNQDTPHHRGVANFVVNLLSALVAYACQEKEPFLVLYPVALASGRRNASSSVASSTI